MAAPTLQAQLETAASRFQSGQLPESEAICRTILKRDPWNIGAMNLLAGIFRQTGRGLESLELMKKIVTLVPQVPEVHVNYGDLLLENGSLAEAEASYRKAIALRPQYARAWHHCGIALERLNKLADAFQCFERVVELEPGNLQAILRLAENARKLRRTGAQKKWSELALSLDPENYIAMRNYASALYNEGRFADAIVWYRKVILKEPTDVAAYSALLLALNYDPHTSSQTLLAEHSAWERALVEPFYTEQIPPANDLSTTRLLRIGYVSPDFKEHAVGRFFKPVLQHHDRNKFALFGYFAGYQTDGETDWYRSQFSKWRDIASLPRADAARIIRDDAIDILVDLAGHTGNHRLDVFAVRPAPVLVTWLGYPCTTGMRAFDYLISDDTVDPPGLPATTSEAIWRLPEIFSVFAPPGGTPPVSSLPAMQNGCLTFGSLHNLLKLNDQVLDLWCSALRSIPDSRLLIYRSSLLPHAQQDLRSRFTARGIRNDRLRLEFERPKSGSHFEIYHQIDLHLDTIPWNGHTTTCEALWMGVPTLSLLGERRAGRMSASMLRQVGLADFVAHSSDDFVAKAVAIASDINALARLRQQLRSRMEESNLMNSSAFVARLETAYRDMFCIWAGKRRLDSATTA